MIVSKICPLFFWQVESIVSLALVSQFVLALNVEEEDYRAAYA